MAKRNELYKCAECGNIVEVLVGGECGGGKMEHGVENTTDATEVYAREYCNLHGLWRSK